MGGVPGAWDVAHRSVVSHAANVAPVSSSVTAVRALDGFLDDASTFAAVPAGVHEATAAYGARTDPAQGSLVLRDTDVPLVRGLTGPLAVVVTGGAGQVAGPVGLCRRLGHDLARLEVTLRDPGDPAAAARRVVAAVAGTEALDAEAVHVGLPAESSGPGWAAAADEVSLAGHRLAFGLGGVAPATVLAWIDLALDRETAFSCSGGSRAVTGAGALGFLNVLAATALLFDGEPGAAEALAATDARTLLDTVDVARGRRWLTAWSTTDPTAALADLASAGAAR